MTQEELAERCEKSLGTIQLLETGKVWPELDTIQKLARVFRIPESALFNDPDTVAHPSPEQALEVLIALVRSRHI